jgi:hypothetical protein
MWNVKTNLLQLLILWHDTLATTWSLLLYSFWIYIKSSKQYT